MITGSYWSREKKIGSRLVEENVETYSLAFSLTLSSKVEEACYYGMPSPDI